MPRKKAPFIRLYENIAKKENGCWEWTGQVGSSGYGQIKKFGSFVLCHRLSYELHFGEIEAGKEVCHRCDNRRCINPDHLFLATHIENMRDMITKGRRIQGKPNPRKGAKSSQSKQVIVLGKPYGSIKQAEKKLGLSFGTVRYWLNTNNPKAQQISKTQYEQMVLSNGN